MESVLSTCRMSFVAAGEALREIRESRLYRTQFGTFEDYCQQRWGINRDYGNKMIRSAGVVKMLDSIESITPLVESQARELTRLEEPDQQLAAWEKLRAAAGIA